MHLTNAALLLALMASPALPRSLPLLEEVEHFAARLGGLDTCIYRATGLILNEFIPAHLRRAVETSGATESEMRAYEVAYHLAYTYSLRQGLSDNPMQERHFCRQIADELPAARRLIERELLQGINRQ